MKNPLVSIVTVVFNGVEYIEQTIQSVLNQSYSNIEYIIIDGGSIDGTLNIIEKYKRHLAYHISEKDSGIYNAMNKGIKVAKGEIIAILNADDYYYADTIESVVNAFHKYNSEVVYGNITKLRRLNNNDYFKDVEPDLSFINKTMSIFHPATFIKKEVYDKHGNYDEVYKLSSDYAFIYKIYNAGVSFHYLAKNLTIFRIGGATSNGCLSYIEGHLILKQYNSPFANEMKNLVIKCKIKSILQKTFYFVIQILGLQKWHEKRLIAKWK